MSINNDYLSLTFKKKANSEKTSQIFDPIANCATIVVVASCVES